MNICKKRLLYRSVKRGCRETELLLTNFATSNLETMSSEELVQYEKLLDMSDHDLYNCFMNIDFVDLEQGLLVKKIIAFNKELI